MDADKKPRKKPVFTRISHLKCTYCDKPFTSLRNNSRYCCRTCANYACRDGKVSFHLKNGIKKVEKSPEGLTKMVETRDFNPEYKNILENIDKCKKVISVLKKEAKKNPIFGGRLTAEEKKLITLKIDAKLFEPKIIIVQKEVKLK